MKEYVKNLEKAVIQYLGKPVLEKIKTNPKEALGIYNYPINATMMFLDVRSFTDVANNISPDDLFADLNGYLERMSEIVLKHKGYIDSITGDCIFAFWGMDSNKHADEACKCALECLKELKNINASNKTNLDFDIEIGINTGNVSCGNYGSVHKMKFSAMGSEVNLASRLASITKSYGVNIVVSQMTVDSLKKTYSLRELDKVAIKGRNQGLTLYSLQP